MTELLLDAASRASRYVETIGTRRVPALAPDVGALGGALPENGTDAAVVLGLLDQFGSPATVANTGGRYFGFVTGGVLPAALAANWLAGAWDQNAALRVMSPVAAQIEEIAIEWLRDLFGLPGCCGAGFVTGATMANFTALAAARHSVLERAGWDVEEDGLFGAPAIRVVVGGEVHVSLLKALSMLGLGRSRVLRAPVDEQGRMRADQMPRLDERTIVCLQAGNVNTGAFDPAGAICSRAHAEGAWAHVDGAFGMWAAASPGRRHLAEGLSEADSWATDCHKWLNVPYDSGIALVRDPAGLRAAMGVSASYLQTSGSREPAHYTPEASRRARAIEIWAALRSLGRRGVAEMIDRCCGLASRFAERLRDAGYAVLNDVVLNQVLVSFGDVEMTRRVIAETQREGTCWCGGAEWQGRAVMRISVSCWATTEEDIDRSAETIVRIARGV